MSPTATKDNGAKATSVTTCPVRLSYAHLFEPRASEEGESPRYSCVILIPKGTAEGRATIRAIQKGFEAAAEAGKHDKFGGRIPSNLATTLYDGDERDDLDERPEYEGMMYMSISSKTQPGIVDKSVQPILDSQEMYSGVWARVQMNCFAYNNGKKKGVSFGLNHVQKVRDDDYLGGRSRAEDVFEAYDDDEDSTYDDGEDLLGL